MARQEFGSFTKLMALYRCGNRCECTGCPSCAAWDGRCSATSQTSTLEFDHIIDNENNEIDNVRALCSGCHQAKTSWVASYLGGQQTSETTAYGNALHELLKQQSLSYQSSADAINPPAPIPSWLAKLGISPVSAPPPAAPPPPVKQDLYGASLRALQPPAAPIPDWLAKLGVPPKPRNPWDV